MKRLIKYLCFIALALVLMPSINAKAFSSDSSGYIALVDGDNIKKYAEYKYNSSGVLKIIGIGEALDFEQFNVGRSDSPKFYSKDLSTENTIKYTDIKKVIFSGDFTMIGNINSTNGSYIFDRDANFVWLKEIIFDSSCTVKSISHLTSGAETISPLPDTVEELGKYCFSGSYLKGTLSFPSSIRKVDEDAIVNLNYSSSFNAECEKGSTVYNYFKSKGYSHIVDMSDAALCTANLDNSPKWAIQVPEDVQYEEVSGNYVANTWVKITGSISDSFNLKIRTPDKFNLIGEKNTDIVSAGLVCNDSNTETVSNSITTTLTKELLEQSGGTYQINYTSSIKISDIARQKYTGLIRFVVSEVDK